MTQTDKAAIIGGGVIGGGWAARFLLSGWDVSIYDPSANIQQKTLAILIHARRSLPALADVAMPTEGRLSFSSTIADAVAGANWIQESTPERLDIKHTILQDIQKHCDEQALIGSSTSGFKPSQLQEQSSRPNQIFVSHPFNPVYLLPLVELVGHAETIERAQTILRAMGMKPLIVRKEIDAHLADRLLEAVWREALWLINDDVASTSEIDDVIRFGFGLRWAQMGLFETYRIAGGEDGMKHFIQQFGPCLKWPWTKLTDVPELTQELIDTIASQSDHQSGHHTIGELERIRDDNLVAILRTLKDRNWGPGALLVERDDQLRGPTEIDFTQLITSVQRVIPIDWTDYNGHMKEGRYGQVFSDAADEVMRILGADKAYVEAGNSYFTVETQTKFLAECHAGAQISVRTQILEGIGKKLRLYHVMMVDEDKLTATCDQTLIHVDLTTRQSCMPLQTVIDRLSNLVAAHKKLPQPG